MKLAINALGLILACGVAQADDAADWDTASKEADKGVESVASDSYCGGSVTFSFDKASYEKAKKTAYASRCGEVIATLGSFCAAAPAGKADILKAVKSFTCHYDASLKSSDHHAFKFKKNGTNVDVFMNTDSSNFREEGMAFYKEAMPLVAELPDWDYATTETDKGVESVAMDSYCGGKVSYSFDKESYRKAKQTKFASRCGEAIATLGSYCSKHPAKKALILKTVKSFTCHYDPKLKTKDRHAMKFTKKGTNVDVFMNTDSSNFQEEGMAFYKTAINVK